ncbi:hypothetical protein AB840_01285 [Megasphaera cerevisiae DSM 20462]|uniref:RNA-binding protein KhpB n=1 Tax=Megasphaera cerevisiae DSM 20462 TaxID=1122219 RepID=A0A0J6WW79_9FIRM|nr:RNA-binding cell elongation regulator Jag/EloR [Megasphaera cerevisiae]KMO87785.1 hypothetical protein AB840_01285 [Megasphaera cerevisiae DSM 20462]OKY53585.1 hypothetical protein BSR42_06825 [Megasphaera cerevisiae]SJZ62669.1 spoIIIJ-associated protein [Megasphaera cerevisiae DSM 20462]
MSSVESTGKTIEDAVRSGLVHLGKTRDEVEVEVLEEPKSGFLGFGSKPARVRIIEKKGIESLPAEDQSSEIQEDISAEGNFTAEDAAVRAKNFLQEVLHNMGIEVIIEKLIKADKVVLHLHGKNLGILIGKHGQTLDALQYLTNLTTNQGEEARHFVMLDVENYRQRREETLKQLAIRLSERVKRSGDRVVLEPMNGYERKIIHMTLQNQAHVCTESEGQDPYRHVVIYYQK